MFLIFGILDGIGTLPIHPAFVHFPIALLTLTWVFVLAGYFRAVPVPDLVVGWFEWLGIAFLPLTIVTGVFDADGLGFLAERIWSQPLIWHFLAAISASFVFTGHAIWRRRKNTTSERTVWIDTGLVTLGFWLLLVAGLLAGEMVYT
jgi:uncharacterized membrane protein